MKKLVTVTTVVLALLAAPAAGVAGAADASAAKGAAGTHHLGRRVARALVVAADAIGISARDLGKELRGGKSVAEVAEAHDVDPADVVDAIVAAATEKIDAAVDAGKLDESRAATIKDRLDERVTKLVDRELGPRAARRSARAAIRRHARRGALGVAAEQIGIEPGALREELRSGKSVAQVAQAHGVAAEDIVGAIVAAATEKIDAAVDAGKLDESRAATIKDHLDERATKLVNHTR